MKLLIGIIFLSNIFSSCTTKTYYINIENANITDTLPNVKEKAEQLKKAYLKLSSSPYTTTYQQEYFEAFPNTFMLLNKLFGYSDKEPLGKPISDFNSPLQKEAELYVTTFFTLNDIEHTLFYDRIIDISINGRWYADGVNYFQHGMQEKVRADINMFCELLSRHNEKEIKGFWYFYFDSPHPIKEIPQELQKVKEIDIRMFSLMELALIEVQQAWKEK